MLDRTDLELYGEQVEISFVARIRGMVKFDGVDALVETMAQDVVRTRSCWDSHDHRADGYRAPAPRPTEWFLRPRAALLRARAPRGRRTARCTARTPLVGRGG